MLDHDPYHRGDLGFDGEGNLYILELGYDTFGDPVRLRKVDASGRITTVAGPGAGGEAGRLVLGSAIGTTGLAVDEQRNIYLGGGDGPDIDNRVIRVDPSGRVTTVAGTGEPGFSGDGGPATEATLQNLWDVAVDPEGNLYVAGNNRIRRVDSDGVITTIVGAGTKGFSGDDGPRSMLRPTASRASRSTPSTTSTSSTTATTASGGSTPTASSPRSPAPGHRTGTSASSGRVFPRRK